MNNHNKQSLTIRSHVNIKSILVWVLLTITFRGVFNFNILGGSTSDFKNNWQKDSELLVSSGVIAQRNSDIAGVYGLASPNGQPYVSQLGFPGYFARLWTGLFNSEILSSAQEANLWFFAGVIALLTMLLYLKTSKLFWVTFLISISLSPWIIAASNNAYWVIWTWFLPPIFSLLWTTEKQSPKRSLWFIFLVLSFVIRFCSGYEFVTSLILASSIIPFVILRMNNSSVKTIRNASILSFRIFLGGIFSFFLVLLVHGSVRGKGNIAFGIADIFQKDVLRRTYGDANQIHTSDSWSLNSNVVDVVNQYFFGWTTNLLQINIPGPLGVSIPGSYIFILVAGAFSVVLYRFIKQDQLWKKDLSLLLFCLAIPISWFVLAKSHSAVHVHINFVLWYVFTLGILLFVLFSLMIEKIQFKFHHQK